MADRLDKDYPERRSMMMANKQRKKSSRKAKAKPTRQTPTKAKQQRQSPRTKAAAPSRRIEPTKRPAATPVSAAGAIAVPIDSWPSEAEWRQSGLCAEAQADGVPCTKLGRRCEICEHAELS